MAQVSFWMDQDDEAAFVARVRSQGAAFMPWTSRDGQFGPLDPLPSTSGLLNGAPPIALFAREAARAFTPHFSKQENLWEAYGRETIEFLPCLRGRGVITDGRIFVRNLQDASDETIRLYRNLDGFIRRTYLKADNGYLGPAAQAHHARGLHFFGSIPDKPFRCMVCWQRAAPNPP